MRPDAQQWARSLIADYGSNDRDSISAQAEARYDYIIAMTKLYEADARFRAFLSEPTIGRGEKKAVVESLLPAIQPDPDSITRGFFGLLVEKRRFALIRSIANAVRELLDEEAGILRIRIVTASRLDGIELERLQRVIAADTGARRICATEELDPAIIAGVKIYSDGTCWDGSVTGRLKAMEKKLSLPLGAQ